MHPVNKLLSLAGLRLSRTIPGATVPKAFRDEFDARLAELHNTDTGFEVYPCFRYDAGTHPKSNQDFECEFVARNLNHLKPKTILDIGSYRQFVIGLLAGYNVTTLDVRERNSTVDSETVLTSDAKHLDLPSESFDVVVSLCALEHFGLGRYGDDFDIKADEKAFSEMLRVLKPGGALIFTTTVTRGVPQLGFNAHRIYTYEMITEFCQGLSKHDEAYFSYSMNKPCTFNEVTQTPMTMDVYCGTWIKA